jgi:hypothetical protein
MAHQETAGATTSTADGLEAVRFCITYGHRPHPGVHSGSSLWTEAALGGGGDSR